MLLAADLGPGLVLSWWSLFGVQGNSYTLLEVFLAEAPAQVPEQPSLLMGHGC